MRDTDATTVRPRRPSTEPEPDDLRPDDQLSTDDEPPADELRTDDPPTVDDEFSTDGQLSTDGEHRADELGDGELDERPSDLDDKLSDVDDDADRSTQDSDVLAADVIMTPPDPIGDGETDETPITDEAPVPDETPALPETPTPDVALVPAIPASATVTNQGLWAGGDAKALRKRWRDVQLRFVDDPALAAREAGDLVDEAAQTLVAAIEARRTELSQWRSASGTSTEPSTSDTPTHAWGTPADATGPETPRAEGETERMRVVVQAYRAFLDEVLKL